jgi:hypothetical protein
MPDSYRSQGRFTAAYWKELAKMKRDLKSFVVEPGENANMTSGLTPKAKRTMRKLDKEFLSKRRNSRSSDIKSIKKTIKKYDR